MKVDEKTNRKALERITSLFGRYLRPQWRKASLMAGLLLGSIALQLAVPQILRTFIDTAVQGGDAEVLLRTALLFLGAALANQILGAGATYSGADVGWTATNLLRRDLARHCLSLDMSFHNARTPGEMIERIDGDVTALSNFFSQFSVRVLGALLLLLGILVLLWLERPFIGLALTAFTLLELALLGRSRRVAVPASELEREVSAKLFGFIEERLAGIEDLRANGGGAHAMHRFMSVIRGYFWGARRAWMLRSVIWLSSYGLFILGSAVTLGASIYFVRSGDITIGTGYMVFQYLLMLQTPIEHITRELQELQKAVAGIGRMRELFEISSRLPRGKGKVLPPAALSLSVDRVGFAYDDRPILEEISFRLEPGRVLGLLGRTGSGKTTLTRLIFRLYDPTEGTVRLGGVDTREADLDVLRQRVGMVTQEVQLFQASVRDNLTFFANDVPDERIQEVLAELDLGGWLAGLPQGLDTVLSSSGSSLSAGEAQLLAFARVFLKDPGLIVLDEPSSRLDPATERRLERALDRLLHGRTAIIIAHRLETVERADDILVLEDGRVVESGPRVLLAADPRSRYATLRRSGVDLDVKELV
ncbi:MAG: ABC transporter ATP-binding protein [Trueperaceae bacterium]|nr:MAG: ABC transporter ATP-binding protein [Trueperaceae bacterium]